MTMLGTTTESQQEFVGEEKFGFDKLFGRVGVDAVYPGPVGDSGDSHGSHGSYDGSHGSRGSYDGSRGSYVEPAAIVEHAAIMEPAAVVEPTPAPAAYDLVAKNKRCDGGDWFNEYGDAAACMQRVLARPECHQSYFIYARNDGNCRCASQNNYCGSSNYQTDDNSLDLYEIKSTTGYQLMATQKGCSGSMDWMNKYGTEADCLKWIMEDPIAYEPSSELHSDRQQCAADGLWYACSDSNCASSRSCASNGGIFSCACDGTVPYKFFGWAPGDGNCRGVNPNTDCSDDSNLNFDGSVNLYRIVPEATPPPPTLPPSSEILVTDTLTAGKSLIDTRLVSASNAVRFEVQNDGNMVIYQTNWNDKVLWESATAGTGSHLELQGDGNLVLYSDSGVMWSTSTDSGARLVMQDDCNLVLYKQDASAPAAWASDTSCEATSLGELAVTEVANDVIPGVGPVLTVAQAQTAADGSTAEGGGGSKRTFLTVVGMVAGVGALVAVAVQRVRKGGVRHTFEMEEMNIVPGTVLSPLQHVVAVGDL
jgi:hypothetical protein